MKIAIPTANGSLAMHFGHCEAFTVMDAEPESGTVGEATALTPPPHAPGVLPKWLAEQGVDVVIAGGMGRRAQDLFSAQGIDVVVGAAAEPPEALAGAYLAGRLATGENVCDH